MNVKFLFGEAFRGLRRNLAITFAMIVTASISLVMLGVGIRHCRHGRQLKAGVGRPYRDLDLCRTQCGSERPDCDKKGCGDLRKALLNTEGVKSVRYRDQHQSLEVGKKTARADTAEIFDRADARAMPGTLLVKLNGEHTDSTPVEATVSRFPKVAQPAVQARNGQPAIYISDSRELINRLFSFLDLTRNAAYALAAFLGLGALALIANMVQMAAFTRRKTTQIMRAGWS
ncbi:MAG: permease-like cell division protein FtsX [Lawsonella clevelandensis]